MMRKNEKLYFHGKNGFESVDYEGRVKEDENILITSANERLPCETVYFDERDGLELRMTMTHTERQKEVAFYTHAFCFSGLSIGDIAAKGEENDDISRYIETVCFASAADVNKFAESRKKKIEPGWVEIGSKNETSGNKTVPNRNLVWKIIYGVICDKKQVRLIVPAEYDLIVTFRCSVIEILKHVPYGMWNRFSFSVNEDNSKRKVVFETGNSAKSGEYLIDVPHDEKSEPNNNFDWLIWKCIYEDDFRRKLYNEYESGFRAKACIEDASYTACANVFRRTDYHNLWELFKRYSDALKKNKGNAVFGECCKTRFISELEIHKKNLGDVLTSPESDFLQCETPSQLKESLDKLKESLDKHSILLSALKDNGVTLDGATSKTLIERATELKGKEPKDILKETHDFYEELKTGDTHSRIIEFLSNEAVERRMQKLEAENGEASEKYLEDIKAKLETALRETSGSSIDVHAGSNEKNEKVGAGRDGACMGSKQGENRGSKRKGKQPSEPRKDRNDNVRAEEEPQDEKDTSDSHDAGDLNADRSRGESDSTATLEKLLEEMKECKEATIAEDIQKKYSKNVREAIERTANGIETKRFENIVNCECVKNFCCSDDIERLEADCEKRKEADEQKERVLESMTGFKAFIEWYCEKGKQVNWRGECIDRLRKNIQENVCVVCSVKDLMHAAQFVSGKYDIYEDQTVYDAVKLIIENGLVSIKVNKNKTLDDIREELLYLRYLKPEEGDDYKIKCLTEGYLAGSSGKKNSTQEEKIQNKGSKLLRKLKEKHPCRKKTDGNSGESSPFEIKLGIALDLIKKIEEKHNNGKGESDNPNNGESTDQTSQFSGCSSRKNDASTWDECKNAQLKESCIRMLKECNLNENEKTELRQIENELKNELGGSVNRCKGNIRLIVIPILLVLVLVLVLSFAGIYLYNYFFAEDEELIPTQPPATAQSPATTQPTVEPTVDPASIHMQKAQAERRKEFSRNSERLTSAPESNEPVTTAGTQQ